MKNDAFNKVNGARGRHRHWSASRPRLSPPPEPSPKPKAEERQSAEEPAGGPAADPKARTSRTATSNRVSDSDDGAATGGAIPALDRTAAAATRPQAAPKQGRARGSVAAPPATLEPRLQRQGQPASGPGRRERRRPGPAASHARASRRWEWEAGEEWESEITGQGPLPLSWTRRCCVLHLRAQRTC